jgi:hypothetical protein
MDFITDKGVIVLDKEIEEWSVPHIEMRFPGTLEAINDVEGIKWRAATYIRGGINRNGGNQVDKAVKYFADSHGYTILTERDQYGVPIQAYIVKSLFSAKASIGYTALMNLRIPFDMVRILQKGRVLDAANKAISRIHDAERRGAIIVLPTAEREGTLIREHRENLRIH